MIKFTAHSSAPIQYLNADAKRFLKIMGKDMDSPKGIITEEQLPVALLALEQAIEQDEARTQASLLPADPHSHAEKDNEAESDDGRGAGGAVTLRHRALPLLQLLRTAQADKEYVIWEG